MTRKIFLWFNQIIILTLRHLIVGSSINDVMLEGVGGLGQCVTYNGRGMVESVTRGWVGVETGPYLCNVMYGRPLWCKSHIQSFIITVFPRSTSTSPGLYWFQMWNWPGLYTGQACISSHLLYFYNLKSHSGSLSKILVYIHYLYTFFWIFKATYFW